ncbi:MAG: FAD-dependent oxidoreductase, partial [Lactobacillus iners]|nr:FAD-dependent oxidoreductase [Lactobacillus iners]
IPGLANAVFVRYGKMHRNTYISSPEVLNSTYETKLCKNLFFAGQMTGVEGYVESAGSGLVAGINASLRAIGESPIVFPKNTAIGSMANYITSTSAKNFQPMNASYSLMPQLEKKIRNKQERHLMQSKIALDELNEFKNKVGL